MARYQEELEWAIDPWKRSFWEEKLAKTQENLARYGWDLEPLEIQQGERGESGEKSPLSDGLDHDTIDAGKEEGGHGPEQRGRPESASQFLERSFQTFHRVREIGDIRFGFREPLQYGLSANARAFQRELTILGVPSELIDGEVEWNRDGWTETYRIQAAASFFGKIVFIKGDTTVPPKNGAGHEAYHFLGKNESRRIFNEILWDNLLFAFPEFLKYQDWISQMYFGGEIDLSDQRNFDRLTEELGAYISGDIHEGSNEARLRMMLRDYDAVKEARQTFIKEVAKEGR